MVTFQERRPREKSGKIIAAANFKGGVAKTTLTATLGHMWAKAGKTVLLLDLDGQANLTSRLAYPENCTGHIGHALHDLYGDWKAQIFEDRIQSVKIAGIKESLDFIPGDKKIDTCFESMASAYHENWDEQIPNRLYNALAPLVKYYDYILIDTPPALDALVIDLILNAAHMVIIPVDGVDAIDGMLLLQSKIDRHRPVGHGSIQTIMCAPHYSADRKIPGWYPLLKRAFPQHFLSPYVKHNVSPQRTIRPGETLHSLTQASRAEWKELIKALEKTFVDTELPTLTQWKQANKFNEESFKKDIEKLRTADRKKNIVSPVRFRRG